MEQKQHSQQKHTSIKSSYDEPTLEPRKKNYDGMIYRSRVHCESAARCSVLTSMVHRAYDKLEDEIKQYKEANSRQAIITHEDGSLSEINDLRSPTHVRSRGRPKKRLGSNLEKQIASNSKKKKTDHVI
ncbi:hypothetical protein PIB30_081491 [Stylosanthes scabra]|uniref:Uncharacterized protein n=1 Tax=Stylosanthes scabra TaxID=79078 RepID=A0ABU6VRD8_9FABA|nr:hypothetical protein [Stylosanthes scabra]